MLYFVKEKINNKNYIKKIFCGLFKINFDLSTGVVEYYFFGIKVCIKYFYIGKSIYKVFNYLTFNFGKNDCRKFLYPILLKYLKFKNKLISNDIIGLFNRSGETFLFFHHLNEYCKNNTILNPVFISPHSNLKNILNLFDSKATFIEIPRVFIELYYSYIKHYEYNGIKLHIPLPHKHFIDLEKRIRNNEKILFYDEILKKINTSKDIILPNISSEIIKSAELKMKMLNLNNKFVFLTSQAQSNGTMSKYFWDKLPLILYEAGYDVFYNDIPWGISNTYQKTCFLTFSEARYVASKASAIIGVRSGLMDVIANKNSRIFCVYHNFFDRGPGFPEVDAGKVLSCFSLKQLPYTNTDLLYEYNGLIMSEDEILNDINKKLGKYL